MISAGRVVAVVGEAGAGKATVAALARRRRGARRRILHARAPADGDAAPWLDLWTPELRDPDVCVIVSGSEPLSAWAAEQLGAALDGARRTDGRCQPVVLTAAGFGELPDPLAERHRPVEFSARAARALSSCAWPGNVRQLRRVVRDAVARADLVDVQHLAPEVLDGGRRALNRLERLERDEIVRCLTEPGTTVTRAAGVLGIGRATLYRKIAQYGITLPG